MGDLCLLGYVMPPCKLCVNYPPPYASPVSPLSTQGLHFLSSSPLSALARATSAHRAFMHYSSIRWFPSSLALTLTGGPLPVVRLTVTSTACCAMQLIIEMLGSSIIAAVHDNEPPVCLQISQLCLLCRTRRLRFLLAASRTTDDELEFYQRGCEFHLLRPGLLNWQSGPHIANFIVWFVVDSLEHISIHN